LDSDKITTNRDYNKAPSQTMTVKMGQMVLRSMSIPHNVQAPQKKEKAKNPNPKGYVRTSGNKGVNKAQRSRSRRKLSFDEDDSSDEEVLILDFDFENDTEEDIENDMDMEEEEDFDKDSGENLDHKDKGKILKGTKRPNQTTSEDSPRKKT